MTLFNYVKNISSGTKWALKGKGKLVRVQQNSYDHHRCIDVLMLKSYTTQ